MTGEEFVNTYARSGVRAWERAALDLARQGQLTPWPWIDVELSDGQGNRATIKVLSDVVSVGPIGQHLRLPLTSRSAQAIADLSGAVLPTPWLVYQIWRAAPVKLTPDPMTPNQGANLDQFAKHSKRIDDALRAFGSREGQLIAGQKKSLVVSNLIRPGKEVIFGWYKPEPDIFTNRGAKQPIQPHSNVHGEGYVDYSHGIRLIDDEAIVNGRSMPTEQLYRHPTLSHLVSHEGPVRTTRYTSNGLALRDNGSLRFPEASKRALLPTAVTLGLLGGLSYVGYVYRQEIANFLRRAFA